VIRGAETSKLGAAVHGAELKVHFLKSFQEGRICEILSQKGPKKQKSRLYLSKAKRVTPAAARHFLVCRGRVSPIWLSAALFATTQKSCWINAAFSFPFFLFRGVSC
jgi:hypothetical protein